MAEQAASASAEPGEVEGAVPKYSARYYREYSGGGGPYERNERWLAFFDGIAEAIARDLRPLSALDAGCAMGMLVEGLRNRGVEASGIDVSEYAISQVDESVRDYCSVGSITDPLSRRYDLITCIEVIEHLPPEEARPAIANLCRSTDRILLSSTPHDHCEPTHLNVQPPETWSAMLAGEGFLRNLDHDASYLTPWAALYVRSDEPLPETVRRYDRSWWHLRWEVAEMRRSLLDLQRQLESLEDDGFEGRSELEAEMALQKEEVLRLRDLLVGKDAELGVARGRLAELEDRSARLSNAAGKVQSKLPGLVRVLSAVNRLRGRG